MSDTTPTTVCPDAATLRALLDATLPEDRQATTQAHVDRCSTCEATLRAMTAGGESWIGMAEKLKGDSPDDPKLAAAMERLKTGDGSTSDSSETADPQRTLDFLQPSDDPKSLGRLGQHEVLEVVGWGGMGVVLKAYDPGLHRVVAVKVLASHLAHHAVARKRFIREAQAAAAVCHDNVVTIHAIEDGLSSMALAAGVGDSSQLRPAASAVPLTKGVLPKIIMQFVAGGSLQERIDSDGPLELKEILRIAMQTAAGLAAAHAQGVVHRDVKPANILLENGVQRVKLTDFGLARVMDDASLTLSGVIAGTPQYMAPEQAWGRDVDARADLFSLGAVMYAMCSGHSPFRARTTMAVLKRVCEDAPRPLRAINPDVPEWLVAIIEKLLAKNPDERFQTATEVSELLAKWLAHVQQPNVAERPQAISVRRGSPEFSHGASSDGDLRSNPSAGSGDPRTARIGSRLSPKVVVVAMIVTSIVLAFLSVSILEGSPQNLASYLSFAAIQLLATFAMASAFRAAWNTSSWVTWIAVLLFLPVTMSFFSYLASYRDGSSAMQFVCGLQALTALAYEFGLLFVRPLFVSATAPGTTDRFTRRQRLTAVICGVVILTAVMWLLRYVRSEGTRWQPPVASREPRDPEITATVLPTNPGKSTLTLSSSPTLPGNGSSAITTNVPKSLLGRWVVVSSEGAALESAVPMADSGGSAMGSASPFGNMMAGAGGGGMGPAAVAALLQWIEFAEDRVVVFDGREAKLAAEFSDGAESEPKRLSLRFASSPSPDASSDWRYGIYRLERDRLIICWTNNGRLVPTEFASDIGQNTQLLVLRREWSRPSKALPDGNDVKLAIDETTDLPKAVIPFTAREAVALQSAWAEKRRVPIETTNSLGMKLRMIPPGGFDLFQQQMLASVYRSEYREVGVVFDPPVPSRPLYLAAHEVTLGQFRKFVEATQYVTSAERLSQPMTWKSPGIAQDGEEHPVVRVSWTDASAFCQWLSETEHESYRLPQFAEWAFAARAGLAADIRIKPPVNSRLKFFDTTAPVGGDTANVFGLHDLFGNVSEWTLDVSVQPGEIPLNNGQAKPEDKRRVFNLGGGFRSAMSDWQTANGGRPIQHAKSWLFPREADDSSTFDDVGFRVAREIAKPGKTSENLEEPAPKEQQ